MSRLEVPLIPRTLRTTGDVVVYAELVLAVKTNRGSWELLPFLVDPGTLDYDHVSVGGELVEKK